MTDTQKDVSGTTPDTDKTKETGAPLAPTGAADSPDLPKDESDLPDNWDNSSGYAGAPTEQPEDQ